MVQKLQNSFDQLFGLGAGDEDGGGDDEIQAPEFLMAGDVLRGNAAGAFGESGFISSGFVGGQLALGVSVEKCSVTVQGEHEKEFGVHAWGRDVIGGEPGDGGGERVLQVHGSISPQGELRCCVER